METGGERDSESEKEAEIKRVEERGAPASSRKGNEMETGGNQEELGTAPKLSEDSAFFTKLTGSTGGVCGMHALSCGARYALNLLALLVQTLLALLVQTYKY
jgi:hypothetical protein